MSKLNASYFLLLLMLFINVFLLTKLYNSPANGKSGFKPPHEILVSRLDFTPSQEKALQALYAVRVNQLKHLEDHLKQSKNELFEYSKSEKYDSLHVKKIAANIGNTMRDMDVKVFELLKGIRSICDTRQKNKFDLLFKEVFDNEAKKHTSIEKT